MSNNDEVLNIIYDISSNLEYEVDKNGIVTILEKQDYKIQKLFRFLRLPIPLYKKIEMDKYYSSVFLQINGFNTVRDIGEILDYKFGKKVYPLYERLLLFLNHINVDCKYIYRKN